IAVAARVAEKTHAQLIVEEQITAEVAVEVLHARPHGHKIERGVEHGQTLFDEGFLNAVSTAIHSVRERERSLRGAVEVADDRAAHGPRLRLKHGIAAEDLEAADEVLVVENLILLDAVSHR